MQRNFIETLFYLPFELLDELVNSFVSPPKSKDIRQWRCETPREKTLVGMIMDLKRQLKEQADRLRKQQIARVRMLSDLVTHLRQVLREQKARHLNEVREQERRHRKEVRRLEMQLRR